MEQELKEALAKVKELTTSLDALKTTSDQRLFQLQLLQMSASEATQRGTVEADLLQKEVDIFRNDLQQRSQNQTLAQVYRRRLQRAKARFLDTRQQLEEKTEENERLRDRLRRVRSTDSYYLNGSHRKEQWSPGDDDDRGLTALGMLASQVLEEERSSQRTPDSSSGVNMFPGNGTGNGEDQEPYSSQLHSPLTLHKRRRSSGSTISALEEDVKSDRSGAKERLLTPGKLSPSVRRRLQYPRPPLSPPLS